MFVIKKSIISFIPEKKQQCVCAIGKYKPKEYPKTLAVINEPLIVKNEPLITCLIKHESGGNKYAEGNDGERGILQFLPSTFQYLCVGKYKLENDILNNEVQIQCAKNMIRDNMLTQFHTYIYCI